MAILVIYAMMDLIIIWKIKNVIGNVKISKGLIGIIKHSNVKFALQIVYNVPMINLSVKNAYQVFQY